MAFTLDDLREIDFDNLGDLPIAIKIVMVGIVFMLVLIIGYWFINKPQWNELAKQQKQESELKAEFEFKHVRAANLEVYKNQMAEMKRTFGQLLRKLPSKTEVPGLLEDISNAGITSGLRFSLFKPLPEQEFSFYAELPVEISVHGSYHQLANFISKISGLDRIVAVNDFTIEKEKNTNSTQPMAAEDDTNNLSMDVVVKTYRYKEETEKKVKLTGTGQPVPNKAGK